MCECLICILFQLVSYGKEWSEESTAEKQGHDKGQPISILDLEWQVLENNKRSN